ncbi:DUF547 domain-containing protein, partial [Fulvivirga lutimaris]|nr:DUF547 domain-containing protein [Fulvivirga lutimaris]
MRVVVNDFNNHMKKAYSFIFLILLIINCSAEKTESKSGNPPSHEIFDELLRSNVVGDEVDYKGFIKHRQKFETYLDLLSDNPPNKSTWSRNEQLTYWINAY